MFKKILVPVDGSEHSIGAARLAVNIAGKQEGEVHLLHIIKPSSGDYSGVNFMGYQLPDELYSKVANEWEKVGKQLLEKICLQVQESNVEIKTEVGKGEPARIICDLAQKGNFDLICMGSRGLGGVTGILGSVSSRVSQNATCPVLINH